MFSEKTKVHPTTAELNRQYANFFFCSRRIGVLAVGCAAANRLFIIGAMSQNKQTSQPPRKSNPVLGVIALTSVVAAVAVFLFTRPKGDQPVAAAMVSQSAQQTTSQQQSQPVPMQQSVPQQESQPSQPETKPQPAPVQTSMPVAPTKPQQSSEPAAAAKPASPAAPIATTSVPSPVSAQEQSDYRIPAHFENPDEAEPLAPTLDPATVADHARAAYQVALKKPRLLAQLPCFCYCDRFGHKSLHDCYAGHHAEECDICMREAIEADQMDAQGMTPKEIRDAIIASHHPRS